jgi:hypothetical protein
VKTSRLVLVTLLLGLCFVYSAFAVTPGGPDPERCKTDCWRVQRARIMTIMENFEHSGNQTEYQSETNNAIRDLNKCLKSCKEQPTKQAQ